MTVLVWMSLLGGLLAQGAEPYSYSRPFVQPAPVWDYWYLLLIPLVVGVSVVYKSVKCGHVSEVPRAALGMAGWIFGGFVAAAVGLLVFVRVMQ